MLFAMFGTSITGGSRLVVCLLFCHGRYESNWRLKTGVFVCYFAMVGTSVTGGSRLAVLFALLPFIDTNVAGDSRLVILFAVLPSMVSAYGGLRWLWLGSVLACLSPRSLLGI